MARKARDLTPAPSGSPADVLPPPVSDGVVDEVFGELLSMHRNATLDHAIRTGELIVRRFFGGALEGWRARRADDASLRKLVVKIEAAGQPGLSASGIYRSIEIFDLDRRVGVSGRAQLHVGHARAVIGLDERQQERLLGRAEASDWTAERLAKEVAKLRDRKGRAKGRPRTPTFVKTINAFDRLLQGDDAFADLDRIEDLSQEDALRLADAAAAMKAKCAAVEIALRARLAR